MYTKASSDDTAKHKINITRQKNMLKNAQKTQKQVTKESVGMQKTTKLNCPMVFTLACFVRSFAFRLPALLRCLRCFWCHDRSWLAQAFVFRSSKMFRFSRGFDVLWK